MSTLAASRDITLAPTDILDVKGLTVKVISDVHLGETTDADRDTLLAVLAKYADTPDVHLVLLGDFIDLLVCDDSVFSGAPYAGLSAPLHKLAGEGRLSFIAGNHDLRFRDKVFDPIPAAHHVVREVEATLPYWETLKHMDLQDTLALDKSNTFHRYLCVRSGDAHWLFCHGDEWNFGEIWKKIVRRFNWGDWRDPHYFLWRAIDSVPGGITETAWLAVVAPGMLWKRALAALFHHTETHDTIRAFALAPAGDPNATLSDAISDAIYRVFLNGILDVLGAHRTPSPGLVGIRSLNFSLTDSKDLVAPEDAQAFQALLDQLDLPEVVAYPRKGFVADRGLALASPSGSPTPANDGTLDEFRHRCTPLCEWDRPGSDPSVTVSLDGFVVGHRHKLAFWESHDQGVPLVIDAGAWVFDVKPESNRATVLSIKGATTAYLKGSDEVTAPA